MVAYLKQALQVDTHACLFKAFSHSTNGKSFIWIIASTWDPESLSCELHEFMKNKNTEGFLTKPSDKCAIC
eukprot:954944-Pelagomonas_calceolata.AAC.13